MGGNQHRWEFSLKKGTKRVQKQTLSMEILSDWTMFYNIFFLHKAFL